MFLASILCPRNRVNVARLATVVVSMDECTGMVKKPHYWGILASDVNAKMGRLNVPSILVPSWLAPLQPHTLRRGIVAPNVMGVKLAICLEACVCWEIKSTGTKLRSVWMRALTAHVMTLLQFATVSCVRHWIAIELIKFPFLGLAVWNAWSLCIVHIVLGIGKHIRYDFLNLVFFCFAIWGTDIVSVLVLLSSTEHP